MIRRASQPIRGQERRLAIFRCGRPSSRSPLMTAVQLMCARLGHWTGKRVRELRSRLDLPHAIRRSQRGSPRKGAARHLGISPAYAGLLLKRGIIPGTRVVPGSMWWVDLAVLDSPQLWETLRALRERRQVKRHHDNRTLRIPGISEV
jgi:hypothetical protein